MKKRLLICFISLTLFSMLIMPFGSYNPLKIGFYASILFAGFWTVVMFFYFSRVHKNIER